MTYSWLVQGKTMEDVKRKLTQEPSQVYADIGERLRDQFTAVHVFQDSLNCIINIYALYRTYDVSQ